MFKTWSNFGANRYCAIASDILASQKNSYLGTEVLQKVKSAELKVLTCRNIYLLSNSCLFNCSSHHLTSEGYQIDERNKNFAQFLESYNSRFNFKRRCINKIAIIFGCSVTEALLLVEKEPILFLDEIDKTVDKVKYLTGQNVPLCFVKNNLWILHLQLPNLESRLNAMELWGIKDSYFREFLPLLKLPYVEFFRVSSQFIKERSRVKYGNRIIFLARLLDCPIGELIGRSLQYPKLFYKDLNKLVLSLNTYLEFGIEKKDIVKDVVALSSSDSLIKSRLSEAASKGVSPLKPWVVRCPDDVFQRTLEKHETEKMALAPFKSREEYLIHRLKLSPDVMKVFRSRFPMFYTISIPKLNMMLDFVAEIGYGPTQLCINARVLNKSIDTMRERLIELKNMGIETPSLYLLSKNEKDYQKFVNRIMYFKSLKDEERVPSPRSCKQ